MKEYIERTLEGLLIGHNSIGRRVITGFNFHPLCLQESELSILTFSHVQSYQDYLKNVIEDLRQLGYPNEYVSILVRDKKGFYRWLPGFLIRNELGDLENSLSIRDTVSMTYLDLERIPFRTLEEAGYSAEAVNRFVGENEGYEIHASISRESDIYILSQEFLRKSSRRLYDGNGELVIETEDEIRARNPWPGAWDVPVLVIGGDLPRLKQPIPGFRNAFIFRFYDRNIGEYNFVVNQLLNTLTSMEEYSTLLELGFRREHCLANIQFLRDYVDLL